MSLSENTSETKGSIVLDGLFDIFPDMHVEPGYHLMIDWTLEKIHNGPFTLIDWKAPYARRKTKDF